MQGSIKGDAQRGRRRAAVRGAVSSSVLLALSAAGMLALRWYFRVDHFWGAVLLIFSVLDLGMIVPVWIILKTRLKEIEGGEEDAAAQY